MYANDPPRTMYLGMYGVLRRDKAARIGNQIK